MESRNRIFLKLVTKFDLATSLFRSFELFAIKQALECIKLENPVLDIGCAEGNIAKEIFKNNKIFGLDNDFKFLLKAQNIGLYNLLIEADAGKMPFNNNSFSFLFSNSVLEHIEDIYSVLNESHRLLKPNGLFLFTVPNDNFKFNLFFYSLFKFLKLDKLATNYSKIRNKRLNHFHLYNQEGWAKLLAGHGFKTILMKEYISKNTLRLWDFIAAIQFTINSIFSVFLKIPFLNNLLLAIAYVIKLCFAIVIFPVQFFLSINVRDGCATLIVVNKN